jgi:aromatic ring hydroxylase
MGLMNGREYRASLDDGRQVWISGERVTGSVADHPAFTSMVDTVA